jgi:RNA polymerase sigma factor (sigma-70 family)
VNEVVRLPSRGRDARNKPILLKDRDDDALMLMVRAGEDRAFEVLVRRHQRMALGTAMKYLGDPNSAEDAAQNSFIDLLKCVPSYHPGGKFRAFLAKIVINNCRMANRRARSEASKQRGLFSLQQTTPPETDRDSFGRWEQRRQFNDALSRISPKLREVLILRYAADLSLKEIGETLGIRLGTVKSRLFVGMEKLGQTLEAMER